MSSRNTFKTYNPVTLLVGMFFSAVGIAILCIFPIRFEWILFPLYGIFIVFTFLGLVITYTQLKLRGKSQHPS
jgi:hypothetical protein